MCDCNDDLTGLDLTQAASGDARTAEDLLAGSASPVRSLFWDGARGQRVLSQNFTDDDISIAVASSGNLWIQSVQSQNVTIFCSGTSTLKIQNLTCANLTIYAGYSSTVNLETVNVSADCKIDIHYSSFLRLNAGFMKSISGEISYSSTGCHRGGMTFGTDSVKATHGSAWTSFCL